MKRPVCLALALAACFSAQGFQARGSDVVPYNQDEPPGPRLSPDEAIRTMTVHAGFSVELVAAEPDIVNPVAMTFDERGRIWITESLEYPRLDAGEGRDRVKVLEDTDGDGRAERVSIFAEGLNIPSGIAVGHGGVWVANAPDILLLKDTDGDGRADRREVVVSGFGREDVHELPNSLTWGPDGWLYGLNGVFNSSTITSGDRKIEFTCACWRIDPRSRRFELFAEGTSNPWGIALDDEGSLFVSACVIDHLWHLAETGYYHRQGGPYPPFTWKLGSIVDHRHQKAAYCGLHYFDSPAFPEKFRRRLYMGNIHGGAINVDRLERRGATYVAHGEPDFLVAHDTWFMPVSVKTGPDGCLYILDWYDRYHCYQDARRDPEGIDRQNGRLYRVRYGKAPRAKPFDLARDSDEALVRRLSDGNVYFRDLAQRLLSERAAASARRLLESVVLGDPTQKVARMHALWALIGTGSLEPDFHEHLLRSPDASLRAWGVRAAGNFGHVAPRLREAIVGLVDDPAPDVRLQVAVAARKLGLDSPVPLLVQIASRSGNDALVPAIVWQNLHPLLESEASSFLDSVARLDDVQRRALGALYPRVVDRLAANDRGGAEPIVSLVTMLLDRQDVSAGECLQLLAEKVQNREISPVELASLRGQLLPVLEDRLERPRPFSNSLHWDAAFLAASWKSPRGQEIARDLLVSPHANNLASDEQRVRAVEALIAASDASALDLVLEILTSTDGHSMRLRGALLGPLGRLEDVRVAEALLATFGRLDPELQGPVVELLTQRTAWSSALVAAIGEGKIPTTALNVNQVRKLRARGDADLNAALAAHWGKLRDERNPQREQVIAETRDLLSRSSGNPHAGAAVFKKVCAQCHKMYGEGQDVGPDITTNGRASYEQLLSNVMDPSLVVGVAYEAHTLVTTDGRVLTGLVVERNGERVVLKQQGGKVDVIPQGEIEELRESPLSMMPEDLEKQISQQEMVDLFAYLVLDRPPHDPQAKRLPGSPVITRAGGNQPTVERKK